MLPPFGLSDTCMNWSHPDLDAIILANRGGKNIGRIAAAIGPVSCSGATRRNNDEGQDHCQSDQLVHFQKAKAG